MESDTSMEFNEREVVIFYKPEIKKDSNTYAMAKQITEHIRDVNVLKEPITPTQLKEIVDLLEVGVDQLIEKESEIYKKQFEDKVFDEMQWIEVLVRNPDMLKTPIVFKGKKGIIIETPSNVLQLDEGHGSGEVKR